MKKYNYILSAVIVLVGAGMIWLMKDFPYGGLQDIGGGFWPKLVGAVLILGAVGIIIETKISPEPERTIDFHSEGMFQVMKVCVVMALFCLIMKFFGFFAGLFVMVSAITWLMGERNIKFLILTDVGILVFVYVVFEMLLHTKLPSGILF